MTTTDKPIPIAQWLDQEAEYLEEDRQLESAGRLREAVAAIQERDERIVELEAVAKSLAEWRRPSKRDWENGAVREEFDAMQKSAKNALASSTGAKHDAIRISFND